MPDFANPLFLSLAVAVPLVLWLWLRRRRRVIRLPGADALAQLPSGRSRLVGWCYIGFRGLALLLLVVALAGPRWPDRRTRISTEGVAITMVVDTSGSMAEPDFRWNAEPVTRLEAVKRAFRLFVAGGEGPDGTSLDGRPDDLVGIVTFATRPESLCPLTLSHQVLLGMLDNEQPRSLPTESQTNIGDALAWGLEQLASAGSRRKVIILLSDGEHNVPPPALKPRQAAQLAANLHVPIYAIDAGGDPPSGDTPTGLGTEPAADRIQGQRTLQAVARLTGGKYFRAHDSATLLQVCRDIDRLEKQEISSYQYRRYYDAYPWLGLAALIALGGIVFLENTIWQRIP
jgi:Ca-activated chloride channel family protein